MYESRTKIVYSKSENIITHSDSQYNVKKQVPHHIGCGDSDVAKVVNYS